jgi:hypothetical protein
MYSIIFIVLSWYNNRNMSMIAKMFDIAIMIITVAAIAATTTSGMWTLDVSQAQELTPEQKSAMCNPNNPKLNFVNSTESEICGIPPTPTTNSTDASPSSSPTTGSQPSSIAPSATTP